MAQAARKDLPADLAKLVARPPIYRLLGVAEKVRGKHLNHVWKGLAGIPGLDEPGIPVVVKYLPKEAELDIELACGLASQVLQLPVPTPALVVADLEDIPTRPTSLKVGPAILFGSLFQCPDPFTARQTADETRAAEYIWSEVCRNPAGPKGAVWDELVANPDRHVQNLLYDGSKWWLFDHNLALQPLAKLYAPANKESAHAQIIEHMARVNQIMDQLKQRRPIDHGVHQEADKIIRQANRLKVLAIEIRKWEIPDGPIARIVNQAAVIIDLIALRLAPLSLFLERRLDKNDAETLWTQS